nr:MAG TPA: hypothetical protein [Caudoviricetes sp.]
MHIYISAFIKANIDLVRGAHPLQRVLSQSVM